MTNVTPTRPASTIVRPFERPASYGPVEIFDGFYWVRLPLPFRLNHVNVWLIKADDGWTCIDCGLEDDVIRCIWDELAKNLFGGRLTKIITTHGHTDHIGLSGYMIERFGGDYFSTLAEWLGAKALHAEHMTDDTATLTAHYTRHSFSPDECSRAIDDMRKVLRRVGPQPKTFTRLRGDTIIHFGGADWRIIAGGGHAPEHASFYCAEKKVLIAGDQVLERISPIIGTYPSEPNEDPLSDYLESLRRIATLPNDTQVLPSHGVPFYGLHVRIKELLGHHDERLKQILGFISTSKPGVAVAHHLFERAMQEGQSHFAFAETLAHLNHLVATGRAQRTEADGGFAFCAA